MMLGHTDVSSDSRADIESILRMIIKQNKGGVIYETYLEEFFNVESCRSDNIYELNHWLKNLVCLFTIVLVENYVAENQLQSLWEKVEKHESTYLSMFEYYPTFGMKFTYQIDICLQVLIKSFL